MPQPPAKQFSGIFVCYRRNDCSGHAGRLFDRLNAHFGDEQVFMDVDHIEPGENFVQLIENNVGSCEVLLALIGQSWLTSQDEDGRRLDSTKDFVRLEIASALASRVRVIPVLVQGTQMPRAKDLPEDLLPLLELHAVELSDLRWKHDVDELIGALERVLARRRQTRLAAEQQAESEPQEAEETEGQAHQDGEAEEEEDAHSHHGRETWDPAWWELQHKAAQEKRRAEEEKENQQEREQQQRTAEQAKIGRLVEENRRKGKVKRIMLLILAFALVVGGIALVRAVIAFVSMQQYSPNRTPTQMNSQQTEQVASSPLAKASSETSPGRLRAKTPEVAETMTAQPAESKSPGVWHVAIIVNRTNGPIPYWTLEKDKEKDKWEPFNLPAGFQITHTSLNRNIIVKYDYKYEAGFQEQQQNLEGTIVGHEPNESDKQKATVYYFIVENGDIVMHRQP